MSGRYRSINFIEPSDPGYRAFRAHIIAAQRERQAIRAEKRLPALAHPVATTNPVVIECSPAAAVADAIDANTTTARELPLALAPPPVLSGTVAAPPAVVLTPDSVSAAMQHAEVARAASQQQDNRARSTYAFDAEYFIRRSLKRDLPVTDRRILRYEEERGRRFVRTYRELDVVAFTRHATYVFEIKASKTVDSVRRGIEQLSLVREILRNSFVPVITTLVIVDTTMDENSVVARFLQGSSRLSLTTGLDGLGAWVVNAIRLLPADVQAMSHRPLMTDFRPAA